MTGRVSGSRCCFCGARGLLAEWRIPATAFPQIILNGELVGGLDIFKEALESGEWDEMYEAEPEKANA
jgi:hypothetical protein